MTRPIKRKSTKVPLTEKQQLEIALEFEREENRQWSKAARKLGCRTPVELITELERVFKA